MADAAEAMARAHQALQVRQAAATQAALSALWDQTMDPSDIPGSFLVFREKATVLIGTGRTLAERQATSYYRTLLAYKGLDAADLDGFTPTVYPTSAIKASLSGATGKHLNKAYFVGKQGLPNDVLLSQAKADMLGSAKRQMLNASRDHLIALSRAHKKIRGWARVSDGKPCGFCAMLVGRGPVYSDATVDFGAHDKCGCSVRLVTYDEADGGWAEDAKAYQWAQDQGYLAINFITADQLAALNRARRAAGQAPKTSALTSARFVNGLTADDIRRMYREDMADIAAEKAAAEALAVRTAEKAAAPAAPEALSAPPLKVATDVDAATRKSRIKAGDWRYIGDQEQRANVLLQNDYRPEQMTKKVARNLREGRDPWDGVGMNRAWLKEYLGEPDGLNVERSMRFTEADARAAIEDAARWLNVQPTVKPRTLYKGLDVPKSKIKALFKEGSDFELNASSFTTDDVVARRYSSRRASQQVMVRVKGAEAIKLSRNPSADFWKATKEHLVTGTGRITSVTDDGRTVWVDVTFG